MRWKTQNPTRRTEELSICTNLTSRTNPSVDAESHKAVTSIGPGFDYSMKKYVLFQFGSVEQIILEQKSSICSWILFPDCQISQFGLSEFDKPGTKQSFWQKWPDTKAKRGDRSPDGTDEWTRLLERRRRDLMPCRSAHSLRPLPRPSPCLTQQKEDDNWINE